LAKETTDDLETVLGPYFSLQKGETVDMKLLQQQAERDRECSTGMCPHVSPLTLKRAAEEGTIQKVQIGDIVFMYYDESANLKQRPINSRANQYARSAKTVDEETIYGDIFLANPNQSLRINALRREEWFEESV
jgi:hypothetical protein